MSSPPGPSNEADMAPTQRNLADKITAHASAHDIRIMIACGAKPSGSVVQGLRPLHYAVHSSNLECIRLLLARGADDINAFDDVGYSALHLAAEAGNLSAIQLLLGAGAKSSFTHIPEADYPTGYRSEEPLRLAIKNGHYEAAYTLLEAGADPNAEYFSGPEISLISPTKPQFINLLINHGARVDIPDREGFTPLMRAARHPGGTQAALVLMAAGADINTAATSRQDFRTPLHYAILANNEELVNIFLTKGANVHMTPGVFKPGPLDVAVLRDNCSILGDLLAAGADPNAVTSYVGSPLHLAICSPELRQTIETVRRLLEAGADPNICPKFGEDDSVLKAPLVEYFRSHEQSGRSSETNCKFSYRLVHLLIAFGASVIFDSPFEDPRGLARVLKFLTETGVRSSGEHRRIWRLLLEAGEYYRPQVVERLPLPIRYRMELHDRAVNPPSLQHAARAAIRRMIVPFLPDVVDTLPLTHVVEYLPLPIRYRIELHDRAVNPLSFQHNMLLELLLDE